MMMLPLAICTYRQAHLKDAVDKLPCRLWGPALAAGDVVQAPLLAILHTGAVQHFWIHEVRRLTYHPMPEAVCPVKPTQQHLVASEGARVPMPSIVCLDLHNAPEAWHIAAFRTP